MNAKNIDFTGIAYLVGIGIGALVIYKIVKAGPATVESAKKAIGEVIDAGKQLASDAIDAVNPTNSNNVVNRLVQPIVDRFIGSDPEAAANANGAKLLAQMTDNMDRDDAEIGAAGRVLSRRPDLQGNTVYDQEDHAQGVAIAEGNGLAFVDYSKLARGAIH